MPGLVKRGNDGDVAIFDPARTATEIAASPTIEKALIRQYKNGKDPLAVDRLMVAVAEKVTKQAKYVVWRDGVASGAEPKRSGKGGRVSALKEYLPPADPGDVTVHRWRKRLCAKHAKGTTIDQTRLAAAIEEAQLRCQRACEFTGAGTERGTAGTGEFERYTPSDYIEAAREVMGSIDLDPASNKIAQKTVKAQRFFTPENDGLTKQWRGNVWLNPPYHRELQPLFIAKLIEEVKAGRTKQAILLTNNSTDTDWFLQAAQAAQAICFTVGRVAFLTQAGEELAPTQGQAFFYYGKAAPRFRETFAVIGFGVTLAFKHQGGDNGRLSKNSKTFTAQRNLSNPTLATTMVLLIGTPSPSLMVGAAFPAASDQWILISMWKRPRARDHRKQRRGCGSARRAIGGIA